MWLFFSSTFRISLLKQYGRPRDRRAQNRYGYESDSRALRDRADEEEDPNAPVGELDDIEGQDEEIEEILYQGRDFDISENEVSYLPI